MLIEKCPQRPMYLFSANREFAQTQDCPAQTRNSNFAAQSWDCAASSALERHFIGHPTCKVATMNSGCASRPFSISKVLIIGCYVGSCIDDIVQCMVRATVTSLM